MKPLLIWVTVVAVIFGVLAYLTVALRDTERVFVAIDTSFPMRDVWTDALAELDRIDDDDYTEFALVTEKKFLHSWQSELVIGNIEQFAPCSFDGIDTHAEVAEADTLILITTPGSCDVAQFTEWDVILLEP